MLGRLMMKFLDTLFETPPPSFWVVDVNPDPEAASKRARWEQNTTPWGL